MPLSSFAVEDLKYLFCPLDPGLYTELVFNNDSSKRENHASPDTSASTKSSGLNAWMERLAEKSSFARGLHNIVIIPSRQKPIKDTLNTSRSETQFTDYEGKIIRKVIIKKLDVFGTSVFDTSSRSRSWIEKTGNRVHVKTTDYVINKNILVRTGDRLDPFVLADNERLLRSLSSIEDVRFIVSPAGNSGDSVDILVLTKDVWSLGFDMSLSGLDKGNFSLWERNLMGTGHDLQSGISWEKPITLSNGSKTSPVGYDGFYRIRNIGGSFIDGRLFYTNLFENKSAGISLARNFFIENVRYAGGLQISHVEWNKKIDDTTSVLDPERGNTFSFWTGRSFSTESKKFSTGNRSNFIFTIGISHDDFNIRPPVAKNFLYDYQNKTLILGTIGFSEQNFYKSNLIFSFGRTEDIPYGSLIRITGGTEYNEFGTRGYMDYSYSMGQYLFNWGYLYSNVEFGSFIRQQSLEQGVANLELDFFTNLFVVNQYYFRHFLYFNYMVGFHPFIDEYVTINDKFGLNGFTNRYIRGDRKAILRYESVMFTPWCLLDFRIATYGFADFAYIGYGNKFISESPLYTGLGAGIRIRNEKLVFNTLQLGVAYYPVALESGARWMFQISGETRLIARNFFIRAPSVLRLR
jgi:hypothetical protein